MLVNAVAERRPNFDLWAVLEDAGCVLHDGGDGENIPADILHRAAWAGEIELPGGKMVSTYMFRKSE